MISDLSLMEAIHTAQCAPKRCKRGLAKRGSGSKGEMPRPRIMSTAGRLHPAIGGRPEAQHEGPAKRDHAAKGMSRSLRHASWTHQAYFRSHLPSEDTAPPCAVALRLLRPTLCYPLDAMVTLALHRLDVGTLKMTRSPPCCVAHRCI